MSSGRLFEDFVPVDESLALITTGKDLQHLNRIELFRYKIVNDWVFLLHELETLIQAENVRLGGMFGDELVYSDVNGVRGVNSKTAHQPFLYQDSIYYTDDSPTQRIYKDGEIFVDHFDDIMQLGNPCWFRDKLYFEARNTDDPKAVDQWNIYILNDKPELLWRGANPAGFGNKLFWGEWNGRYFDYRCTEID